MNSEVKITEGWKFEEECSEFSDDFDRRYVLKATKNTKNTNVSKCLIAFMAQPSAAGKKEVGGPFSDDISDETVNKLLNYADNKYDTVIIYNAVSYMETNPNKTDSCFKKKKKNTDNIITNARIIYNSLKSLPNTVESPDLFLGYGNLLNNDLINFYLGMFIGFGFEKVITINLTVKHNPMHLKNRQALKDFQSNQDIYQFLKL